MKHQLATINLEPLSRRDWTEGNGLQNNSAGRTFDEVDGWLSCFLFSFFLFSAQQQATQCTIRGRLEPSCPSRSTRPSSVLPGLSWHSGRTQTPRRRRFCIQHYPQLHRSTMPFSVLAPWDERGTNEACADPQALSCGPPPSEVPMVAW